MVHGAPQRFLFKGNTRKYDKNQYLISIAGHIMDPLLSWRFFLSQNDIVTYRN